MAADICYQAIVECSKIKTGELYGSEKLDWRINESNESTKYKHNHAWNELMPLLVNLVDNTQKLHLNSTQLSFL